MTLRCQITGNPVGTDTWRNGFVCHCSSCRKMLEMTEPRPPIHPAPGDWPEDQKDTKHADEVIAGLTEWYGDGGYAREAIGLIRNLRAELAAANERAEKAEQTLLKQPDWKRHWEQQVNRREEVQKALAGVMLERDSLHVQWQSALREIARKDAALREIVKQDNVYFKGSFDEKDGAYARIARAALEPRKEGGE